MSANLDNLNGQQSPSRYSCLGCAYVGDVQNKAIAQLINRIDEPQ
jgi:hypothetical protein